MLGEGVPPAPPVGLDVGLGVGFDVGLEEADGLDELDGEADGDEVGEELGEAVGVEVGDGDGLDGAVVTGGATAGGTLVPAVRSCCHDHPTDPPAGTVSDITP